MKIYRISYSLVKDNGEGTGAIIKHQEFEASDGAASKRCTAIKAEFKDELDDKPTREAIDVPTNKADLIDWLNKHATITEVSL